MSSLLLDLRHAVRVLVKNPTATALAVFTLALAIGAATAIFSVVYAVVLRPLQYPAPGQLMAVWEVTHHGTYARLAGARASGMRKIGVREPTSSRRRGPASGAAR